MTADKSAATWHPGDGPVKPLDVDALTEAAASHMRGFVTILGDGLGDTHGRWGWTCPCSSRSAFEERFETKEEARLSLTRHVTEMFAAALAAETARAAELEQELADFVHDTSPALFDLGRRLQASEARADQAEQRIADAPHGEYCAIGLVGAPIFASLLQTCNCWKSAAPTTEQ